MVLGISWIEDTINDMPYLENIIQTLDLLKIG